MNLSFEIAVIFIIGLVLGSFTTALSWRVARRQPWVGGRSECPSCHAALGPLDLIPLFSWLALRGCCRHCKAAIGARYPLTELVVLAGCFGIYSAWHFTAAAFIGMAALPFLATLFMVDLEQMILPDSMLMILSGLGVGFMIEQSMHGPAGTPPLLLTHILGAAIFAGAAWVMGKLVSLHRKKDALGFGDVKFFAVAGLWLGLVWLPWFLIAGGLIGVGWGIAWRLWRGPGIFPFGPALIMAFYACLCLAGLGFHPI